MNISPVPKPRKSTRPKSQCRCGKWFTARALLRHAKGCGKPNRYGSRAVKSYAPGEKQAFPSRLEALTYELLKERSTVLRYLPVELIPGVKWKVDFTVYLPGIAQPEWAEAKGVETDRYKILIALWRELGPGKLTIYKAGRGGAPVVAEVIIPRRKAVPNGNDSKV